MLYTLTVPTVDAGCGRRGRHLLITLSVHLCVQHEGRSGVTASRGPSALAEVKLCEVMTSFTKPEVHNVEINDHICIYRKSITSYIFVSLHGQV